MSFGSLVFTPLVKKLQERYGSRRQYERMENSGGSQDRFTPFESEFLAQRDSFYLATTGSTGWPYVQHRGGPKGFLKVIDDHTLAFGDFRGNKQYISTGNLLTDSRVAIIMVDYPRQARLKILGKVEILEGEAAKSWLDRVSRTGRKDCDRESIRDPCRSLRLELPAAHYTALHCGRDPRRDALDREAYRSSGAGKSSAAQRACKISRQLTPMQRIIVVAGRELPP